MNSSIGWWQMDTLLNQIYSYRRIWLSKKLDDYEYILLLPSSNPEFNNRIHVAFKKKLNGRKGTVIEGDVASELVRLYELFEFSGKIIIGSFEKPYGRKLQNLILCGIADEETLINDVLLGEL